MTAVCMCACVCMCVCVCVVAFHARFRLLPPHLTSRMCVMYAFYESQHLCVSVVLGGLWPRVADSWLPTMTVNLTLRVCPHASPSPSLPCSRSAGDLHCTPQLLAQARCGVPSWHHHPLLPRHRGVPCPAILGGQACSCSRHCLPRLPCVHHYPWRLHGRQPRCGDRSLLGCEACCRCWHDARDHHVARCRFASGGCSCEMVLWLIQSRNGIPYRARGVGVHPQGRCVSGCPGLCCWLAAACCSASPHTPPSPPVSLVFPLLQHPLRPVVHRPLPPGPPSVPPPLGARHLPRAPPAPALSLPPPPHPPPLVRPGPPRGQQLLGAPRPRRQRLRAQQVSVHLYVGIRGCASGLHTLEQSLPDARQQVGVDG